MDPVSLRCCKRLFCVTTTLATHLYTPGPWVCFDKPECSAGEAPFLRSFRALLEHSHPWCLSVASETRVGSRFTHLPPWALPLRLICSGIWRLAGGELVLPPSLPDGSEKDPREEGGWRGGKAVCCLEGMTRDPQEGVHAWHHQALNRLTLSGGGVGGGGSWLELFRNVVISRWWGPHKAGLLWQKARLALQRLQKCFHVHYFCWTSRSHLEMILLLSMQRGNWGSVHLSDLVGLLGEEAVTLALWLPTDCFL